MTIVKIVGFRPRNHHWVHCNRHGQSLEGSIRKVSNCCRITYLDDLAVPQGLTRDAIFILETVKRDAL
ncbi:hypothetical protein BofuT4_uP120310.1 [Botrytis cinerea T4]|uniref:Uncharacterized protein n=1 Tax=Botryotinia fuckeliana (strain T4) TaxID=999810 RepID=G2XXY8_BOTF4|nr:hypothetical protein BofuT4_uP120310.1 [Botrytis cinerea T4]